MLGIGRQLAPFGVPLIGINQGRLGFITDISLEKFRATLTPMLRGEYVEDRRSLMHARVMRDGHCVFDVLAMNDVVVNRGAISGMVELRVEVGGHFVANQRADGLIIATPTGATAYALSAGGPLLHPSIPGWVLVPIAPHTLSNRPIVLSDDTEVAIEIVAGRDASANFDMQSLASLLHGDRITVRRSKHSVRFLHPRGWSYFDTLREKLHWNEDQTIAYDTCVYTKEEILRITKTAFDLAKNRKQKVTLLDKANVLATSRLWRETVTEYAKQFPEITLECNYIDSAAMEIITKPTKFDVILTENLFGDIISDEASVIAGSLGILPSASIGDKNALYEPIHGSYPQAAGKNIANPMATILSAAMLLENSFGMLQESKAIVDAVEKAINNNFVTEDINDGKFSTSQVGDKIVEFILA